jgi:CheY-like chemotaxis protein
VLIADPNDRMRLMLRSTLSDLDGEILETSGSDATLRAVREHAPDWVLLEVNLVPMGGVQVAGIIRQEWPAIKVIMVTNCDELAARAGAQEAGVFGYILKDDLLEVRKMIQSEKRRTRSVQAKNG